MTDLIYTELATFFLEFGNFKISSEKPKKANPIFCTYFGKMGRKKVKLNCIYIFGFNHKNRIKSFFHLPKLPKKLSKTRKKKIYTKKANMKNRK